MLKPNSLRETLLKMLPELAAGPDKLTLTVSRGVAIATLAASLSYEKQYPLVVRVLGFTGDINSLLVPVIAWLRDNQPDIMTGAEGQKSGLSWEAESADGGGQNITLTLLLTERTQVTESNGALRADDLPEPQPAVPVTRPKELYVHGELVSSWNE
ncbi:phage tail protein [uncultured Pluralibacter sp.]|uniref:phage tail protein n=1 Tax=uncultured Pluralibacter sp. TaxID=1490864 RepID=UPI002602256A|nr:phage tail protein [uncultured Pluralibacter sp.]